MFIEKRKIGKSIKYYLVHSFRENGEVKKIRRYLGLNLSAEDLKKAAQEAEESIHKELDRLSTHVFNFSLSKRQIQILNRYDEKIKIYHFDRKDWQRFTEEFVYNTNAIEGSKVQLEEVKEILENRISTGNPEEIETKGVAKAVNFIRKTDQDLSLSFIKKLHKFCFKDSKSFAGRFRNVEVVIKDSRGGIIHFGVPVLKLHHALDDMVNWYKKNKKKFKPLVLAAIIHDQFEHIHPFQDGNGRVGRLLLNFILIRNDHPPINILLEDRAEYYNSLQEYSKNRNLKPTLEFLIKQYNQMLKEVTTKSKK